MAYVPHTAEDIRAMLSVIGADSVDDLFAHLPAAVRLQRPLDLPPGLSEEEVRRYFRRAALRNHGTGELVCFLGGGVYDAIVPAACDAVVSRSEFLTAYTPYQPEVSQGTLQAIYEWQTYICRLTGLEVANASMYDGATALAEAVSVAVAAKRKKRVVLPGGLNPRYRRVLGTMLAGEGVAIVEAPLTAAGTTDPAALAKLADGSAAAVIQNPNYLGLVEPVDELAAAAKAGGAAVIACVNPVSLAVLKSPGEYGAELAVGEAQPFGINLGWGGPLLGFLACSDEHKRRIPGRVVGRTSDSRGQDGYVLTLQTREQHIRREKATSNICSNQGLNALRATVYLAMLGGDGLPDLGQANLVRAAALRRRLLEVRGVTLPFPGPVFNEFVLRLPRPARLFRAFARRRGVLAGIPLAGFAGCGDGDLLVAVTEKRTAAEIEQYGRLVADFVAGKDA
ncbi:MAG: aminomethyl-transferring glycine dehydrogenase subunit GcvPA [Krumholzibacteria bacterium]|nr:aminomethyl-transferring glycine dehydrogenase subunit GcvPA [Candidatus Krumholzibacteria bacterium]